MNFEQTDDRRMLAETLRRYLTDAYGMEHRTATAYDAPFHNPEKWAELTELGIFYALVDEGKGGMGGHGFDIVCVFEELGRALCPEPVLGQVLAASLLDDPEALLGGTRYALAISETDAPYDIRDLTTEAVDGRLTGRKTVVYGAPTAEILLVAARQGDDIAVFQMPASEADITGYAMIDGGPAGEVFFDNTPATLIMDNAECALQTALDRGALALCAEALGAMGVVQDMLVDYLKTRTQFGQPLGAFQVLQHRTIDLAIEIEQARSIIILAASADGTDAFPKRAAQAKHLVGKIARQVAEEAIQMHGGIGITWEYPLSHYAKRLVMIDHQLGDSDWHLERLMADLA
ncbi:acyl-CoA dehydrogenase family protein [Jannaschia sp. CCS1]|uniref:acyl-CoA dehydrogenase family protein n=1 Tax=Jannaschia sp. (strain CCS1) TaxID=290400 RepID=UPI000053B57A|nr:acyl-CoA dehydrogenase [Jannaschia sp. CCS1]ABD54419.1 acyl-CoA dehydrogenase-like protein [Jannaschia sp. CCS1]